MRGSTIHAFFETAARIPRRPALKRRVGPGRWETLSWEEYAREVRRVARAFIALGVRPGDRVALCGPNRPEWLLSDLGALAAGAVPAPYYPTLPADQAAYVVEHSEARVAVAHDAAQLAKIGQPRAPLLRARIVMQGAAASALGWEEFVGKADAVPDSAVEERLRALEPDGLATLIYTSGTTGPPKAVMISHRNLLFAADTARRILEVLPGDEVLSYLPLSHIAEQMISLHAPAVIGFCVACCERLEDAPEVLREIRPTRFLGVPRVWEKMQARIEERVASAPAARRRIFHWAQQLGLAAARGRRPLLLPLARRLVQEPLARALGLDRARQLGTSAAPISPGTLEFFESLGLPLYEIYGQSECTGASTANLPGRRKPGTVGPPLPGTEVRIAEDGEVLLRGPHVFLGYLKDPEATRATLAPGGWLCTGDVGQLDADGFLRITDRKKDLLITSGGKNVSPQNIEGLLARIPGIAHAVVVGEARKHLAALLTLDREAALREARSCGARAGTVAELCGDPSFLDRISRGVEEANRSLASYETIKKFKLLPVEFSIESGELTPTLKLRRKVVSQRYAQQIAELFRETPAA